MNRWRSCVAESHQYTRTDKCCNIRTVVIKTVKIVKVDKTVLIGANDSNNFCCLQFKKRRPTKTQTMA